MGKKFSTIKCLIAAMLIMATLATGGAALAATQEESSQPAWKNITLGPGKLDLGLSLRFRYEALNNFTVKAYKPGGGDHVLLERFRFNVRYRFNAGPQLFLQAQDARFWYSDLADDPSPKNPYQDYLDLRQAYVEWQKMGGSPLGLKLGRQAVAYGDYHVFGPGDWGNVGRYTWDIAKATFQTGGLRVDSFWGQQVLYNKDEFDDEHLDFHAFTLYGQWAYLPKQQVDMFYVCKYNDDGNTVGESGRGDLQVNTVGLYASGGWRQWDYKATLAWQFGDYGNDRVEAWGVVVRGGYTLPVRFSPRISAGYTQGSGDSDPKDGVHGTFDGVFGAVDKYYGRMNLFCWSNLQDFELGFHLKPLPKLKLSLEGHLFRLSQAKDAWYYANGKKMRQDKTGQAGCDLGKELDFIVTWQALKQVQFMGGLCGYWPGDFVKNTGQADNAQWAFLQVLFKF